MNLTLTLVLLHCYPYYKNRVNIFVFELAFTVSRRIACDVLKNSVNINVDELCIRIGIVELINESFKLVVEDPICSIDSFNTSSTISAVLSQCIRAAPDLTYPNQHELPCPVVVQSLEIGKRRETLMSKNDLISTSQRSSWVYQGILCHRVQFENTRDPL